MKEWPAFLRSQIGATHNSTDISKSKSTNTSEYLTSDLEKMRDLPYWRVQFSKYTLELETNKGSK